MEKLMTTQVQFANTRFSFGEEEEEGLMDFTVVDESEPEDYEGRLWYTTLTPDEMEYLAHRMLDAVAYMRKKYGLGQEPLEPIPDGNEPVEEEYKPKNLYDIYRKETEAALVGAGGDRKKAAEILGISVRTLYRRLKQYGLE